MIRQFIGLAAIGVFMVMNGCCPYAKHLSALHNDDVEKRRNAAFQLSTFDKIDVKMLPKLLESLEDKDAMVREHTIKTIGKMDPHIAEVPQAIKKGLRDPNLSVRRAAAAVFSTMSPVPTEVLYVLAESLGDNDSLLRTFVRSTFVDMGPIGVNALMHVCKSDNTDLRCLAITTLGTIGCEAKIALPTLQSMLNDTSDQVRAAAQKSIDRIQYVYFCTSPENKK